ncbi:unnamed protein product [Rhizophagus irregularis]|nr:unnamed protein product [Rhizophagus irregularis]
MSSLSLLDSSGSIPFLVLTAVFLFISPAIFVGIVTMYGNLKQKISNELSAHVIKILIDLVQRSNFDQQSVSNESNSTNESETNSRGSSSNSSPSSSSGSSNLSGIFDITGDLKICFKQHFDRLMKARNYTFDEMCFSVVVDIRSLGGDIKISAVKNFYSGVRGSNVTTVNQINAWVASFNNNAE